MKWKRKKKYRKNQNYCYETKELAKERRKPKVMESKEISYYYSHEQVIVVVGEKGNLCHYCYYF
jgi:hypothetical protein